MDEISNNLENMRCTNTISRLSGETSSNQKTIVIHNHIQLTHLFTELQKNINSLNEISAEIEIEDCSNVTIDTPVYPATDIGKILNEVLHHHSKEFQNLPNIYIFFIFKKPDITNIDKSSNIQFESMYVKVYPEDLIEDTHDHHVNNLLMKYKQNEKGLFYLLQ